MYFSDQEMEDAKRVVLSFLQSPGSADSGRNDNSQSSTSTSSSTSSDLWSDYDNYVPASTPTAANSAIHTVDMELDNYLCKSRVSHATSIYGFWLQFQNP